MCTKPKDGRSTAANNNYGRLSWRFGVSSFIVKMWTEMTSPFLEQMLSGTNEVNAAYPRLNRADILPPSLYNLTASRKQNQIFYHLFKKHFAVLLTCLEVLCLLGHLCFVSFPPWPHPSLRLHVTWPELNLKELFSPPEPYQPKTLATADCQHSYTLPMRK